jgi:hypothetical protein
MKAFLIFTMTLVFVACGSSATNPNTTHTPEDGGQTGGVSSTLPNTGGTSSTTANTGGRTANGGESGGVSSTTGGNTSSGGTGLDAGGDSSGSTGGTLGEAGPDGGTCGGACQVIGGACVYHALMFSHDQPCSPCTDGTWYNPATDCKHGELNYCYFNGTLNRC